MTPELDQSPRRILIIAESFSAPADHRLWSEAVALRDAQYEVSIICPRRRSLEPLEEMIEGIHIFRHPLPFRAPSLLGQLLEIPVALFWEFLLSWKVARRRGFEVVHICNPPNALFFIAWFYKKFRKKSVVFDFREASTGEEGSDASQSTFAERRAFKIADITVCSNATLRQIAISRGGMVAERVILLRPCPDLTQIAPTHPDPLWKHARANLVAYAGEVTKLDGLDQLASAVAYIVQDSQRADIQFVIAGEGPDWHEIASLFGNLDLSEYVTFTGRVDNDVLCTILSTADVCVDPRQPSANATTTSQKVMEYMAIGKPVVQFDVAEGRLVAQEASRYARPNDPVDFAHQVLELLDSPEARKIMGDFGQKRIQKEFSWQREQRKLVAAYDAIFHVRAQRAARRRGAKGTPKQKVLAPKKK